MGRWLIFISVFLCVYGAFHLYLLIKVRRAFYLEGWSYILMVVVLAYLMLAPIQARLLETQNHPILALLLSWIAFFWMGCLFIWLWAALAVDAYHLGVNLTARILGTDLIHLLLSRRQGFLLSMAIAAAFTLFGVYSAQQIRVEHVILNSPKISAVTGRIRIVQISDVHIGPMLLPGKLEKIVAMVQSAKPDLLVSSGDLFDGALRDPHNVMLLLTGLTARLGKFAVTGNHEVYSGLTQAVDFTQSAGFTLLRGRSQAIDDHLTMVGVDDPATGQYTEEGETALLSSVPSGTFTVLLKHQPVVNPAALDRFDLQISGHTHKGQIMPFGLLVKWVYPLFGGLYPIGKEGHIYVSPGTGTWGPPIRLGASPEITLIDILPEPGSVSGNPILPKSKTAR